MIFLFRNIKMACGICCEDSEFRCMNDGCEFEYCKDCIKNKFKIADSNIKCDFCKKKIINKDVIKMYPNHIGLTILKYYTNKYKMNIEALLAERAKNDPKLIIKKRMARINDLPLAIKTIINISLTGLLKKINKSLLTDFTEIINDGKRCYIASCIGFLKDNRCIICEKVFCPECEEDITYNRNRHICDIATLNTIKSIKETTTQCPTCGTRIFRISGCNYMTCANCKSNFEYHSKKLSQAGNHGQNGKVEYKTIVNLGSLIHRIEESKKSKSISIGNLIFGNNIKAKDDMINVLNQIYQIKYDPKAMQDKIKYVSLIIIKFNESDDKKLKKITESFYKLVFDKLYIKKYTNYEDNIIDKFQSNKLTLEYLNDVLDKLKSIKLT